GLGQVTVVHGVAHDEVLEPFSAVVGQRPAVGQRVPLEHEEPLARVDGHRSVAVTAVAVEVVGDERGGVPLLGYAAPAGDLRDDPLARRAPRARVCVLEPSGCRHALASTSAAALSACTAAGTPA